MNCIIIIINHNFGITVSNTEIGGLGQLQKINNWQLIVQPWQCKKKKKSLFINIFKIFYKKPSVLKKALRADQWDEQNTAGESEIGLQGSVTAKDVFSPSSV